MEEVATDASATRAPVGAAAVTPLVGLDAERAIPSPTGFDELDRVLGGGLTPGSVTLLGGEPGVGKSTLTLQFAMAVADQGATALLVAGEEAPSQVAVRAGRLRPAGDPIPGTLVVLDELSVDSIVAAVVAAQPQVVVVDSVQTVRVEGIDAPPGSVSQLKAVTEHLVAMAKRHQVSVVLIGHLTKDGTLAGPRVIEHLVDTVLSFNGDRADQIRYLRAVKHRFGPTSEVGLLTMTSAGLAPLADPSGRFLGDRRPGLPGSAVVVAMEGRRPVLVEVQALTVDVGPNHGSTTVQGLDAKRVALVSAVMGRRAAMSLARHDVFASTAGGAKVTEPAADLGLVLALASSCTDRPVPAELVACGEIGLGGEVRSVPQLDLRLQEAYRLGFRSALVPASAPEGPTGMRLIRIATVGDALTHLADAATA